jgi:hypothetical protein
MVLTHSRALALSVMPGNRRRTSKAADSSPSGSKMARIAALICFADEEHSGEHGGACGGSQANPRLLRANTSRH